MLYLDFSCTQRLMTPVSPDIKDSLEDRVYAVFSSIFLTVDASVHLLAAAYKSFIWTVSQISRKNPPDYYKEAYSHFVKALRCTSMIPVGSLVGFICPGKFQSKKLQEYLGWKASLTNTSETIENKRLKEELQSKNEEIERLKLQIDSCNKIIPSTVSENNPKFLEDSLVSYRMTAPDSFRSEDIMSVSSDSDTEFVDALEDASGLNKMLEKELQSKNEEIEGLKSQIDSLKIISPTISQHNSKLLKENLVSAKMVNSDSSSSEDVISLGEGSTLNETLEKELQLKNKEIERLKLQKDLLNKILYPLGNLHSYNQILSIQKALNKSIIDAPTVYEYLSDLVKQEIDNAFQNTFKMKFSEFCTQANPDINLTSQPFTELLNKHTFRSWTNPTDATISTIINTCF